MATSSQDWAPSWAVAPGEILLEALEERSLTQVELAKRLDRPLKTINEIIKGKAALTPATALQLERVLGISASLWVGLESRYREFLARQADYEALGMQFEFAKRFPVGDMVKRKLLPQGLKDGALVGALLSFFGVASTDAWEAKWQILPALRNSPTFKSTPESVATWIRCGQVLACSPERNLAPFDREAFRALLGDVPGWTRQEPFQSVMEKVTRRCAEVGVVVIFVRELTGTHLQGAAYWLESGNPVVQLSLRHKRDDQMWFTFVHEAGHLFASPNQTFVDAVGDERTEAEEAAADRFARDLLIEPKEYAAFVTEGAFDELSVKAFAKKIGVWHSIVVGRLQHERLVPPNHLAYLIRPVEVAES